MLEASGRGTVTFPPRFGVVVGAVAAVVAAAFVGRALVEGWDRAADGLSSASPAWLVVGFAAAAAGMAVVALGWHSVLRALGADADRGPVARWYFIGELGKYVPGGVWPLVGRSELARRSGVRAAIAGASVVVSLGCWYLAAAAVAAAAFVPALAGIAIAGVLLAVHPRLLDAAGRAAGRVLRRDLALEPPPWRTAIALVAGYVPAWLLIGGATAAVAQAFAPGSPVGRVAAAAVLSWLAGFVAIPVPAGAGVREAVFVATCGLAAGPAAATAVTARLLFVAVDATAALLAGATSTPGRRRLGAGWSGR